ncbi:TPA: hypothetical protein LU109_003554 [Enterobacter hormaechei subsp. xiangfangensis]|nr:hypothetical protein [Enterobacter hormaechei subsp. xiangfangensis]
MSEQKPKAKTIAVLATSGRYPVFIQAVYIDGVLTLDNKKMMPRNGGALNKEVVPVITRLIKKGFLVMVDEVSGAICAATGANQVNLDTKHHDGRPVIVVAMERFREMHRLGMISMPPGEEGLFSLPPSIVDTEVKPNGEATYRINWDEIKPEHLLTLFCVYGTVFNNVTSGQYLTAMLGAIEPERNLLTPFHNIVKGTETEVLNQGIQKSLAGNKLTNGDKVL